MQLHHWIFLIAAVLTQLAKACDDYCADLMYSANGRRNIARINLQTRDVVELFSYKALNPRGRCASLELVECGAEGYYSVRMMQNICKTLEDVYLTKNYFIDWDGETKQSIRVMWNQQGGECSWFHQTLDQASLICRYALPANEIVSENPVIVRGQGMDKLYQYDIRVAIARALIGIRWDSCRKAVELAVLFPSGDRVTACDPLNPATLWKADVYNDAGAMKFYCRKRGGNKPKLDEIVRYIDCYLNTRYDTLDRPGSTKTILPNGYVKCVFPGDSQGSGDSATVFLCDLKHDVLIQSLCYYQKKSENDQFTLEVPTIVENDSFEIDITMLMPCEAECIEARRTLSFSLYEINQEYFCGKADTVWGDVKEERKEIFYKLEKKLHFTRLIYHNGYQCFMVTDSNMVDGISFVLSGTTVHLRAFYSRGAQYQHLESFVGLDSIQPPSALSQPEQMDVIS